MDEISALIDRIIRPELPAIRRLPQTGTLFQPSRNTNQGANLPSQISGTPVNTGIISNQNLGQQFGLNQTEKTIEQLRKFGMNF
jgi:hypothetical protein